MSILFLHLLDFENKGGYTGRMMKHCQKTVLLLLLVCAACNDNAAPELEGQPVNIMLYACGDNNLEYHILRDLREAEYAGTGGADVTMHVLLDRSGAAVSGFSRWSDSRVYKVAFNNAAGGTALNSQWTDCPELGLYAGVPAELDLSDWRTLAGFVDFCMRTSRAERNLLIISDHGNGWFPGRSARAIAIDDSHGGHAIGTEELRLALAGKDLDVIAFDACNMGQMEVAWVLRDCAEYMVASPAPVRAAGFNYTWLVEYAARSGAGNQALARAVVQSSIDENPFDAGQMTVIDLAAVQSFVADGSFALGADALRAADTAAVRSAVTVWTCNGKGLYADMRSLGVQCPATGFREFMERACWSGDGLSPAMGVYFPAEADFDARYISSCSFAADSAWGILLAYYYLL